MELPVHDNWGAQHRELKLDTILRSAVQLGASDIHIRVDQPPLVRVSGQLIPLDMPVVTPEWAADCVEKALETQRAKSVFAEQGDHDFALEIPDVGRFRVNAYRSRGVSSMVLRHVRQDIPTLVQLGLPESVNELARKSDGLVLVCGPTGSGKSTTLAAMVGLINAEKAFHILTIEDPLEFLHTDLKSSVSQREIGIDTPSFASALRSGLRQDPDVIVIGEIRDSETMSIALQAAETGHLVLASMHAASVQDAIQRAVDLFSTEEQAHVRTVVAEVLQGVVSQRLVPSLTPVQRSLLIEIAVSTPRVRQAISNPKDLSELSTIMSEGSYYGMVTLQQDALGKVMSGEVSVEAAEGVMTSLNDFRLALKQAGYGGDHE
jgi:twitching motility protein PilT